MNPCPPPAPPARRPHGRNRFDRSDPASAKPDISRDRWGQRKTGRWGLYRRFWILKRGGLPRLFRRQPASADAPVGWIAVGGGGEPRRNDGRVTALKSSVKRVFCGRGGSLP